MKKFSYVMSLTLALLIGFASCSSDDEGPGREGSNGQQTFARIVLSQKTSSTRASGDPTVATDAEKKINSIDVYVFDGNRVLEQVVKLTDREVSGELKLSKVFSTTTGPHYFYAVANMPTGLLSAPIPVGTPMLEVEKRIMSGYDKELNELTGSKLSFFMTNTDKPAKEILKQASAAEAEAESVAENKITINIGRAVAKVGVKFDPILQPVGIGELTEVEYSIANNPKSMYLFPVVNNVKNYRESPFFEDANYNDANYLDKVDFISIDDSGYESTYAVENTNDTPKGRNTTTVLIKGKFIPDAGVLCNADGTPAARGSADGTFWRVKDAAGSYSNKIFVDQPDDDGIEAALGAGNTAGRKLLKYTEGICYYTLPLADINETDPVLKHSVLRNSFYKVNISEVNSIGSNGIDGDDSNDDDYEDPVIVDPDEPLSQPTNIKAIINVVDWNVIEQQGSI